MKKLLAITLMLVVLSLTVTAFTTIDMTSYSLYYNETFDNYDNNVSSSGSHYTISTTGCKTSPCLRRLNTNSEQWIYNNISEMYLSNADQSIIIKGWIYMDSLSAWNGGYAGFMINKMPNENSYFTPASYQINSFVAPYATKVINGTRTNWAGSAAYQKSGDYSYRWVWLVVRVLSNGHVDQYFYDDSSESVLLVSHTNIYRTLLSDPLEWNEGYYGFGSYRGAYWDDVEYWLQDPNYEEENIQYDLLYKLTFDDLAISNFTTWKSGGVGWFIKNESTGCKIGQCLKFETSFGQTEEAAAHLGWDIFNRSTDEYIRVQGWIYDYGADGGGSVGSLIYNRQDTDDFMALGIHAESAISTYYSRIINKGISGGSTINNTVGYGGANKWWWVVLENGGDNDWDIEIYENPGDPNPILASYDFSQSIWGWNDGYMGFYSRRTFYWDDIEYLIGTTNFTSPDYTCLLEDDFNRPDSDYPGNYWQESADDNAPDWKVKNGQLEFSSSGASTDNNLNFLPNINLLNVNRVDFSLNMTQSPTGDDTPIFIVYDSGFTALVYCTIEGDGTNLFSCYRDSAYDVVIGSYTTNTVYSVTMYFDWDTDEIAFYVNDVWVENQSMRNPGTPDSIAFNGNDYGGGMQLYIDNFCINKEIIHQPPTDPVLTYPVGGEVLYKQDGSSDINWTPSNYTGTITYSLDYSDDGGSTWTPITTGVSGLTYSWDISSLDIGINYKVRIKGVTSGSDETNYNESGSVFGIGDSNLQITTDMINNTINYEEQNLTVGYSQWGDEGVEMFDTRDRNKFSFADFATEITFVPDETVLLTEIRTWAVFNQGSGTAHYINLRDENNTVIASSEIRVPEYPGSVDSEYRDRAIYNFNTTPTITQGMKYGIVRILGVDSRFRLRTDTVPIIPWNLTGTGSLKTPSMLLKAIEQPIVPALANCTLYVDSILNQTSNNVNLLDSLTFLVEMGEVEKDFTFEVQCENYLIWGTTGVYNYKVDSILPRIREVSGFVQNSSYQQVLSPNVTLTMNFYDPNRYAENDTLLYLGNNTVFWNFFEENVTEMNVTKTFSFDPSTLWAGDWLWIFTEWDSHTKKVKPLPWYFSDGNLIADDAIIFEGEMKELDGQGNPATYFYLSPEEDRYKLKITFFEELEVFELNITTTGEDLMFLADSPYEGHFVYFPNERWIDFEGGKVDYVEIEQLSSNKYHLTVYMTEATDEIEFESIGDLNRRDKYYQFAVVNYVEEDIVYDEGNYSIPDGVNVTGDDITVDFSGSTLTNGSLIVSGNNVEIINVTVEEALIVTGENVTYDTVQREGVEFEGFRFYEGTTDLITEPDLSNVSLTVNNGVGGIVFTDNVDLTANGNLDVVVVIVHNSITVDSAAAPNLNAPAILTFVDSGYTSPNQFLVYRDGSLCSNIGCTNIGVSNGDDANVDVPGFSTYTLITLGIEISQENFQLMRGNFIYVLGAFALVAVLIGAMFIGLIVTGGDLPWLEITGVVLVLAVGFAALLAVFVIIMNMFG